MEFSPEDCFPCCADCQTRGGFDDLLRIWRGRESAIAGEPGQLLALNCQVDAVQVLLERSLRALVVHGSEPVTVLLAESSGRLFSLMFACA